MTVLAATSTTTLLDRITCLQDLRGLDEEELVALAAEVRAFLIENVTRTGGHLGPNLGVVELTIALHRVFDSPRDAILFDTGHQAYVHKILTGRRDFATLRKAGGLSGYPSRAESAHDLVENSHASTALSYADGLAKAFALAGARRRAVAVVGDGALTGGMSWEALNNIGSANGRPVIIVFNDNGRSYDSTIGVFGRRSSNAPEAVFRALGLDYLGPVDGHDIAAVEDALGRAAATGQPVVVHCLTTKGRGYLPAETDEADCMHAVGAIDRETGQPRQRAKPSWTSVFAEEMRAVGAERPDVVCLTGAMLRPTGLFPFAQAHPDRVFDVGIAEQHAVTSAAGLAMGGMHPVVAVYATFLNRAFDQVLMDVALHRLPVTFVLDRAGVTGPDGPSHHGMWDLSLLALVPGLRLAAPRGPASLRELLREAVATSDGPTVLRFPKAPAGKDIPALDRHGSADVLHREGPDDVLLIAIGPLAGPALEAAADLGGHGVGVTVVDPRWLSPLDADLLELGRRHRLIVTVEDNTAVGGLGSRVAHAFADDDAAPRVHTLALPGAFLPHDTRGALLRRHGLDAPAIAAAALSRLDNPETKGANQ